MSKTNMEMRAALTCTTEELQAAMNKLKKRANHQTATGSEPNTSKHATMRQKRW